jgi:hypothetical protein
LQGLVFTTSAVNADCSVTVSFEEVVVTRYTVTPAAGPGGSLSPGTPQLVEENQTLQFTLIADSGYEVDSVGGTCGGVRVSNTFTTDAVIADCSVNASFRVTEDTETPDDGFQSGLNLALIVTAIQNRAGTTGGSTSGCNGTSVICDYNMGTITQTVAAESVIFRRNAITASRFVVGANTSVPAVFFDFAPQGAVVGAQRAWVSNEPGGEPLQPTTGTCEVDAVSRAYTVVAYIAGRSTRDDPTRFCVINSGETYYLNQELLDVLSSQIVIRAIGGAF